MRIDYDGHEKVSIHQGGGVAARLLYPDWLCPQTVSKGTFIPPYDRREAATAI